jgi:hypothetical protein
MASNVQITDRIDGGVANVDKYNDALTVQSEVHTKIHSGAFFTATHYDGAVSDAASVNILIVPSGICHARFIVSVGGDCEVYLYEGTTTSSAGTTVPSYDRNRVSKNAASAAITHSPTITNDRFLRMTVFMPGGTKKSSSGSGSSFEEWVLDDAVPFLLRVTNVSGAASPVGVEIDFYEA